VHASCRDGTAVRCSGCCLVVLLLRGMQSSSGVQVWLLHMIGWLLLARMCEAPPSSRILHTVAFGNLPEIFC
jgi:hypothetical protein